jgi:hypothetical protein
MRIFAFLSGLAFLLAYIFHVFAVKVGVAIQPESLLYAGLLFLVLDLGGVVDGVRSRYGRRTTTTT